MPQPTNKINAFISYYQDLLPL